MTPLSLSCYLGAISTLGGYSLAPQRMCLAVWCVLEEEEREKWKDEGEKLVWEPKPSRDISQAAAHLTTLLSRSLQDYLIALSLQQQQQPQGTLGLSDLELAQQLQQEEYQQQQGAQLVPARAPSPQVSPLSPVLSSCYSSRFPSGALLLFGPLPWIPSSLPLPTAPPHPDPLPCRIRPCAPPRLMDDHLLNPIQGRGAPSGRPAGERRRRPKPESDCVLL